MKTLQRLLATTLLALAIGIPTYAGDVSGPVGGPAPPPPPLPPPDSVTMVISGPTSTASGDVDMPTWETLAIDFLLGALSMY